MNGKMPWLRRVTVSMGIEPYDEDLEESKSWYSDIWAILKYGQYLPNATAKERIALRKLAARYIICAGKLYKRHS